MKENSQRHFALTVQFSSVHIQIKADASSHLPKFREEQHVCKEARSFNSKEMVLDSVQKAVQALIPVSLAYWAPTEVVFQALGKSRASTRPARYPSGAFPPSFLHGKGEEDRCYCGGSILSCPRCREKRCSRSAIMPVSGKPARAIQSKEAPVRDGADLNEPVWDCMGTCLPLGLLLCFLYIVLYSSLHSQH